MCHRDVDQGVRVSQTKCGILINAPPGLQLIVGLTYRFYYLCHLRFHLSLFRATITLPRSHYHTGTLDAHLDVVKAASVACAGWFVGYTILAA